MKKGILLTATLCLTLAARAATPTVADAKKFLDDAEKKLLELNIQSGRADWVNENFITTDTETLSAEADERAIAEGVRLAKAATQFDHVKLPPEMARKMMLLKLGLTLAAPSDPKESAEVTRLGAKLQGMYGKGKYCPGGDRKCLDIEDITRILANSTNERELMDAWSGWHSISPPMRADFARFVELSNKGARELGFKDTGAMWRSKYDMAPDDFAKELDRLWEQVRPLYVSLHAYVRWKLREKYGDVVPATGAIPAQLLGNIWAQDWTNIYKLVAPKDADPGYDLTDILKSRNTDPLQMVHYGENFFKSIGFAPLPQTFWERSLFVKPRDRDVVCHASAWDIDFVEDVRLKVCITITAEDFMTVHHELGHNFYQRAYDKQPFLFRDSANDGFHEAIGDTIALSITPEYLEKLGFINEVPHAVERYRAAAEQGAGEDRVFAVRTDDRSMALEGFFRRDSAGQVQRSVVAVAAKVSRRGASGGWKRKGFRSGREVSRGGERAVHAVFPGGYFAIPVSPVAGEDRGMHGAAESLFDLRERRSREAVERDARDGDQPPLAGCAVRTDRAAADGCDGDPRLFRSAAEMAGSAKQGKTGRLVK